MEGAACVLGMGWEARYVHRFSVAAVTDDHKHSSLKNTSSLSGGSVGHGSSVVVTGLKIKEVAGQVRTGGSGRNPAVCAVGRSSCFLAACRRGAVPSFEKPLMSCDSAVAWIVSPQNSHVGAPNPHMTVFGDGSLRK